MTTTPPEPPSGEQPGATEPGLGQSDAGDTQPVGTGPAATAGQASNPTPPPYADATPPPYAAGPATQTFPAAPQSAAPPTDSGPRITREQLRELTRLSRPVHDRKVAGVAAGLARHFDIDPVILRVLFVVLVFFGGAGLLLYGGLWALTPEDGRDRAPIHLDSGARAIALVGVSAVALMMLLGDALSGTWFPGAWPLAIVALIVAVLVMRREDSKSVPAPPQAGGSAGWATGVPLDPGGDLATGRYAAPPAPGFGPVDPATREAVAHGEPTTGYPVAGGPGYGSPQGPAYGDPSAGGGWPPYTPPVAPPPPPRPRNPRKRGPVLFWITAALVMLALGLLGVLDVAGADLADGAYPALALTVIGGMLVLGAFWGRAGGLILAGLLAVGALTGATLNQRWDGERVWYAPSTAGEVRDTYSLNTGELVVDLSRVSDLEELDGRSLLVENGAGRIELILPREIDADVSADAGVGRVRNDLLVEDGFGISTDQSREGSLDADLDIDVQLGAGDIEVSYR